MTTPHIPHVLPGEPGGDTSWFARMNAFEQQEVRRQVAFRRRSWPDVVDGEWSKRAGYTYPHILPTGSEDLALYGPLAKAIQASLRADEIALHTEARNLRSSQVACLNILFPFRRDMRLASAVLGQLIPDLVEVTRIEFEYTGPEKLRGWEDTTKWLGEPPRGKRGQNRTSIDAAIFWRDTAGRARASLVEWKYTERSFGVCSAFEQGTAADQQRCRSLRPDAAHPEQSCPLCGRRSSRNRRYWQHMASAGINLTALAAVSDCPFTGPLYQLMRQQLVADYCMRTGTVAEADVLVLAFGGNRSLLNVPPALRSLSAHGTVLDAWNRALDRPVLHVTVEELMAAVDATGAADGDWRSYVRERYGV